MDNTNICAGLDEEDDLESAMSRANEGVDRWGRFLEAVGGFLNPEKCVCTVHNMIPGENGEWIYRDTDKKGKKWDAESGR